MPPSYGGPSLFLEDQDLDSRLSQGMTYKINTCRALVLCSALLGQNRDWLAQYQDNASEWVKWRQFGHPMGQHYKAPMSAHCHLVLRCCWGVKLLQTNKMILLWCSFPSRAGLSIAFTVSPSGGKWMSSAAPIIVCSHWVGTSWYMQYTYHH